ncbi:hypothetical protein [Mesotoga sp.]|uniref:hypothetical protein n=1 Tax=Mesotoga sp. TaxID=2053577 RepID=UPI00345E572B
MRRMKLISGFLLVSIILLCGSVFSEEPIDEMNEPFEEENPVSLNFASTIPSFKYEEDNTYPITLENMAARGFYREGEEEGDPSFYYFASSASSSKEESEPVEAVDGFYSECE